MWRSLLSTAALASIAGLAALGLGYRAGWGVGLALAISLAWLVGRLTLVRLAHGAFTAGRWHRAQLLYWLVGGVSLASHHRLAARVSRAACAVALGEHDRALEIMDDVDPDKLDEAPRAAWLNNRAYALARVGRELDDAHEAASEAIRLRPNLPSFRHTRGAVLIAQGRYRAAIRELDAVWHGDEEVSPLLESERCFDLGVAWRELGERDYAMDYFHRARRASPSSSWALKAEDELASAPSRSSAVLVEGV